jgi:histidinol-phosphatase (PHP family)
MNYLFDLHSHSTVSDGGNTPEQMLESAGEKGLKVFALTDHFDIHEKFPLPLSRFDGAGREESYEKLSALKKRDFGVKFINGIEIAQAHQFKETAEKWLTSHEYDFVLGSCHVVRGQGDFYHMDYDKNDANSLLKRYFSELHELCEWGGSGGWFDSLAHLTYPLRYMKGKGDLDKHLFAVDEVFKIMVRYEIALEINTQQEVLCPQYREVKRFHELGGRLITIGSDSHNVNSIAQRIEEGIKTAKEAGFTECVYYEKREKKFIKI